MQHEEPRRRPASPVDTVALGARLPQFRHLPAAHRDSLLAAGELLRYRAGDTLCRERRDQDWAWYLLEGRLSVRTGEQATREIEVGPGGVGECFHAPGQHSLGARATGDINVLRIPLTVLRRFVNLAQVSAAALPDVVELGMDGSGEDSGDGLELALSIGVLARLPPMSIQRLLQRVEEVPLRAGELVLEQGAAAADCFIVKSGVAEVAITTHEDAQVRVALKAPGEFFGEEALITGGRRGATVRMRADGVLLRILAEDFRSLIAPHFLHALSHDEAEQRIADGAAWLDVSEPAEFLAGALPGAINLPLNILRLRCTSLDPRRAYVVCSRSPARSALGNFMLVAAGLDAAYLDAVPANGTAVSPPLLEQTFARVLADSEDPPATVEDAAPAPLAPVTGDPEVTSAIRIGLEDLRAVERQRYQRRLRRVAARLLEEAEVRTRAAVQEVEMSYLTELENKHRQVLDLKRKVAVQQRQIWKLQQAAGQTESGTEAGATWPSTSGPDSI